MANTGSSDKAAKKATDDIKIGMSVSTLNNPFFVTLTDGAKEKAKELGELTVVDAQDNASKQASDVEDLIQQNVDLIIINPTDSAAVASAVESANLQIFRSSQLTVLQKVEKLYHTSHLIT